jgi:alanine racemase
VRCGNFLVSVLALDAADSAVDGPRSPDGALVALTLRVAAEAWRSHLAATVDAFPGLVPVVKGNGYGFGRAKLAGVAAALGAAEVAVGTVHELADVGGVQARVVLTPALADELAAAPEDTVVTVGSARHVDELARSGTAAGRRVIVKIRSSMGRYGVTPDEVGEMLRRLADVSATPHGLAVHPPVAGTPAAHAAEIEAAISATGAPPDLPVYVSHLDATAYRALQEAHPEWQFRIRLGTALWHGDKSFLRLCADVLDVRAVDAGERLGYRLSEVPAGGHVALVTAGTAHGVHPLPGDLSPFHFDGRRLPLVEPPHMHTSMVLALGDGAVPTVGDEVDVQRPLTQTLVDRVVEEPHH